MLKFRTVLIALLLLSASSNATEGRINRNYVYQTGFKIESINPFNLSDGSAYHFLSNTLAFINSSETKLPITKFVSRISVTKSTEKQFEHDRLSSEDDSLYLLALSSGLVCFFSFVCLFIYRNKEIIFG